MTIPIVDLQTRHKQKAVLASANKADFVWIITVRVRPGEQGEKGTINNFVWVPATYPGKLVPYLPVRANDPKKEPLLFQMSELIREADTSQTLSVALLYVSLLDELGKVFFVYEFPFSPDEYVCPACGISSWVDPRSFVPNGCLKCGFTIADGGRWSKTKED